MTLSGFLKTGTSTYRHPELIEPNGGFIGSEIEIVDIQDTILDEYKEKAMGLARYKKSPDGKIYGEITKCRGVWVLGSNRKECEKELKKVLSEWIKLKMEDGDRDLPVIGKIDINFLSLSGIPSKTNA